MTVGVSRSLWERAVVAVVALVTLTLTACSALTPAPTPTPVTAPTATPAPTATLVGRPNPTPMPQGTLDPAAASPAELENAFLSNVDDLIAEAADLTTTPCADLTMVTRDNPNLVPSVRGFAAAVKRIAASQTVLNTDAVKAELSDLDHSMGELDGALSTCGIKQP